MSEQSCACSRHSLSWSRRVSSELWPQKVRRPPPRDPFYARASRAVHSLISRAPERPRLLPGNREASPGQVRKYITHHLLPETTSTKLYLGCGFASGQLRKS
ncbi:hypothetical protein AVEN_70811-1 [Araneus ventricosus]|uniref:Uncharacterized protein n=1 Tax=Araneus ventricosus TaxID=182803 RepID=A0A4Y2U365_ARAVE|nr:hypothetical protein AVEN_70811-1 [Araneus ventricosus]